VPGAGSLTVAPNDAVAAGAWGQRSGGPGNPQQLNRYSYVLNNPIIGTDPSGHINGTGEDKPMGGVSPGGMGGGGGPVSGAGDEDERQRGGVQGEQTGTTPSSNDPRAIASEGKINPHDVRFSQDSINYRFKDGRTVDDLADGLRSGKVDPDTVPSIRLVERNGQLYTLDNRRLEAFRRAEMEVNYRMATRAEIQHDAFKFTTQNEGLSIIIRGGPR